ncbi:hypothetical protein DMENIID0001_091120 [Sergentomyia squamirostris]
MAKSPPPNAEQGTVAMPPPSLESPTSDSQPRKRRRKRNDPQNCNATAEVDYDSDETSPSRSCSDVESFQGKIVYNSDGSAYIIDSDNDSNQISENVSGVISTNNPKIHSFRVVMAREASINISELNRISKPVLMCFICKLSFGNAKSFGTHASNEHNLTLLDNEKTLLSREYSSAILQRNIDERPQISFLEPLNNHQNNSKQIGQQMGSEKLSDMQPSPIESDQDNKELVPSILRNTFTGNTLINAQASTVQEVRDDNTSPVAKFVADMLMHQQHQHQAGVSPEPMHDGRSTAATSPTNKISELYISNSTTTSPTSQMATPSTGDAKTYVSNISPTSTIAPSFTIGACPDHINGRPIGVDCIRCEMILSTARLGSGSQISTRNSCKTLKCPQCNWHYKYQETLEIHMREKHPDGESACGYCLAGQQHPRLARGESYTCGYKPYRCEICNYSTTTKGNLSIHMQSDKHLNNMQELNSTQSLAATPAGVVPVSVAGGGGGGAGDLSEAKLIMSQANAAMSGAVAAKPKPSFRCDVCSYETNVARNLRIHMTSEKHTHNMAVLQNNLKHLQALSLIQHSQNIGQCPQLGNIPALAQNIPASIQNFLPEAALADFAYNQAIMIHLLQQNSGGSAGGGGAQQATQSGRSSPVSLGALGAANAALMEQDAGLSPDTFEPPFDVDTRPNTLFTCLVCTAFNTNSLEELNAHLTADRTRAPGADVMLVLGGNYICRLCNYKTNLKANFQLHSKTDKHLQKVAYMNHLREGGAANEYKFKYSGTSVVQLKCNACDYYTNSIQKLGIHCQQMRHDSQKIVFQYFLSLLESDDTSAALHCQLCNAVAPHILSMMQHVKSLRHVQMEQIVSMQRRTDGFEAPSLATMYRLVEPELPAGFNAIKSENQSPEQSPSRPSTGMAANEENVVEKTLMTFKCELCNFQGGSQGAMERHAATCCHSGVDNDTERTSNAEDAADKHEGEMHEPNANEDFFMACPLCQESFSNRIGLEQHVMGVHSVTADGLSRLLNLVDKSKWEAIKPVSAPSTATLTEVPSTEIECSACGNSMSSFHELLAHSNEKQHFHHTNDAYVCILKSCQQVFPSITPLIQHYKDTHLNIVISEKHVYKYRCKLCSLAFKTQDKLNKHSVYHAMRDATKCNHCGRSFRTAMALQKHVEQFHRNAGDLSDIQSVKSETELDSSMEDGPVDATTHLGDTTDPEDFSGCPQSEEHFNDPTRKHQCNMCRVAFTHYNFLMQHYRSSTHRRNENRTVSSSYPVEKYLDPNRPFKCDICRESFTQKNILLVHYNSVSHLHKLKKQTETTPSTSPSGDLERLIEEQSSEPETAAATPAATAETGDVEMTNEAKAAKRKFLVEDDYESPRKRFKCDICKVAYAQGSTLDIHMRSVLHQTRACRLQEQQQLLAHLPKVQHDLATGQVVVSSSLSPTSSTISSNDVLSPTPEDDQPNKINNHVYKTLLENFGFDIVKQFNEINKHVDGVKQEEEYYCRHCKKTFSSIFVLKTHCEEMHNDTIPIDFLEKFAEKFKTYYLESGYFDTLDALDCTKKPGDNKTSPTVKSNNKFVSSGIPVSFSIASTSTLKIPQVAQGVDMANNQADATAESQLLAQKLLEQQQSLASLPPAVTANISHNLSQSFQTIHNFGAGANLPFNTIDMINLMQIHHLMSLNFMNMAPPLVYGAGGGQNNSGGTGTPPTDPIPPSVQAQQILQQHTVATQIASSNQVQANQKRARTRITDDQLKILRAHFDINNSPSEESIMEMSKKANLPMKVVKHWFRNTLFKERQRNKDSPYNFNNPPSTTLNLEEYERTGQAKITKIKEEEDARKAALREEENNKEHNISSSVVAAMQQAEPISLVQQKQIQQEIQIPDLVDDRHAMDTEAPTQLSGCNSMSSGSENNINMSFDNKMDATDTTSRPQTPIMGSFGAFGDLLSQQMECAQNMGPPKKYQVGSASSSMVGNQPSGGSSSSGKRANRTRFTDYQIKVLQEFFENNSYPKDSDLEYLSKLLLLSPRVIVVWFQNARQKQRKIYENQPNNSFFESEEKKSNINYTCKKCNLVFQRYYELIRHQKNHCFKEENNKKSAKAQIAAAQIAHSLSSEDSNSSVDIGNSMFNLGHPAATTPAVLSQQQQQQSLQPTLKMEDQGNCIDSAVSSFNMTPPQLQSLIGTVPSISLPLSPSSNVVPSISNSSAVHQPHEQQPEQSKHCTNDDTDINNVGGGVIRTSSSPKALAPPPRLPQPLFNIPQHQQQLPPSTADVALDEGNLRLECDKCSALFTRRDLHREHYRLHENPQLVNDDGHPQHDDGHLDTLIQQCYQQQQSPDGIRCGADDSTDDIEPPSPELSTVGTDEGSDGSGAAHEAPTTRDPAQPSNKRLRTTILPEQLNYLYECYQNDSNPSRKMLEEISKKVNLKKRVVQVWYQNSRARERKGQFRQNLQLINKKCPYCSALFKIRSALESHLQQKHPDEVPLAIDQIPDVIVSPMNVPALDGGGGVKSMTPLDLRNVCFGADGAGSLKVRGDLSALSELKNGLKNFNGFANDEAAPIEILMANALGDRLFPASSSSTTIGSHHKKRHRSQMTNIQISILSNLFGALPPTLNDCEGFNNKNELGFTKKINNLNDGHYIDDFVYLI